MTESIQIQLKKGALELCVLALLARRESYAYEIASTLADARRHGGRDDLPADAAHAE